MSDAKVAPSRFEKHKQIALEVGQAKHKSRQLALHGAVVEWQGNWKKINSHSSVEAHKPDVIWLMRHLICVRLLLRMCGEKEAEVMAWLQAELNSKAQQQEARR